jgi:hypothetical protein
MFLFGERTDFIIIGLHLNLAIFFFKKRPRRRRARGKSS